MTDYFRFGTWSQALFETGVPTSGGGTTNVIAQGYDTRTAAGFGNVQLVTATRAVSSIAPDALFVTRLTLQFMPEPSSAAMLLAGSGLALLLSARARRRKRPASPQTRTP